MPQPSTNTLQAPNEFTQKYNATHSAPPANRPGESRAAQTDSGGDMLAADVNQVSASDEDQQTGDDTESARTNQPSGDLPMTIDEDLIMLPFAEARAIALERFDRQFLTAALARHSGNIARTARALGLHRQSLQKLMGRRGIKPVRPAAKSAAPTP